MKDDMQPSRTSIYRLSLTNKKLAAYMLLPLIEFEFCFFGVHKPWIAQCVRNTEQLRALFMICKNHGWNCGVMKSFRASEVCFKLNNRGFREIYTLAGPMADPKKDEWAKLLCERVEKHRYKEKEIIKTDEIWSIVRDNPKGIKTMEICLKVRRLPSSVGRHLQKLKKDGRISKNPHGWFASGLLQ